MEALPGPKKKKKNSRPLLQFGSMLVTEIHSDKRLGQFDSKVHMD